MLPDYQYGYCRLLTEKQRLYSEDMRSPGFVESFDKTLYGRNVTTFPRFDRKVVLSPKNT